MTRRPPLQTALRRAVQQSPLSRYSLARAAGVSDGVISRFMRRKQGITLDTAERLAKVLGLALTAQGAP